MLFVFFFQAEDGIRDLVRSRGLGDVYKRQVEIHADEEGHKSHAEHEEDDEFSVIHLSVLRRKRAVSYTHLTLPTSDLV